MIGREGVQSHPRLLAMMPQGPKHLSTCMSEMGIRSKTFIEMGEGGTWQEEDLHYHV